MSNTYKTLEFNKILEKISDYALSENAKNKILTLSPFLSERECKKNLKDTTEAKNIIDSIGNPPITSMLELDKILTLAEKGSMLSAKELTTVSEFIYSCERMVSYLKKAEFLQVNLAFYGASVIDLNELYKEIDRSIRNGNVESTASRELHDIRRKIDNLKSSVKLKIEAVLRSKKEYLSDNNIVIRNDRYALPVKKAYKNQVQGVVIDTSNTGGTVFIEPSAVGKIQDELNLLQIEEENEVRKILYTLSAAVDDNIVSLKTNVSYMEMLDFVFAKAKYSNEINGVEVPVTTDRIVKIIKGRHPLLKKDECVPLDFDLGENYRGIIITGPNTGGKTVSLKTVGLLSLMAQCGLHVPAEKGSTLCMHANFLCDIGDGQSISENLSTFSAHITNIVSILEKVSHESLVLLDELGSGTDPAEGMGIAVAILDELRKKNCLFLATTHYPEIKDYAKNTPFLINARMGFDKENLKPLYKLQIGEAGESCALSIAERLGLPKHLLERARKEAYHDQISVKKKERFLDEVETEDDPSVQKHSKIKKDIPNKIKETITLFQIGDSVIVFPEKNIGIVYKPADEKGDLVVQIKGEKKLVNHTRVKLKAKAVDLYPPDYDYSIIFDSVENRKARHKMTKGHVPGVSIEYDEFTK